MQTEGRDTPPFQFFEEIAMAFIDMETYRKACLKARELVDPITLMAAIHGVYDMWFDDKRDGRKIVFHAYFGLSLLDLGIDRLVEAEQYRKALAAYFQPRALKRLAELRAIKREKPVRVSANNVEFANSMRVRIRVDEQWSIVFRATRRSGPLMWRHVVEVVTIIHSGDGTPGDEDRHNARKQALMVLNRIRTRTRRTG